MVRCHADPGIALWTQLWPRDEGKVELTLTAKTVCTIDPEQATRLPELRATPSAVGHHDDDPDASLRYPGDHGPPRSNAHVFAVGTAHAHGGEAREMEVGFRFGEGTQGFRRRLLVTGPRHWERRGLELEPGRPSPFRSLPLRYEHAFGGPAHPANPHGVGAAGVEVGMPLHRIEHPQHRLTKAGDLVPAVGFGPMIAAPQPVRPSGWWKATWPFWPGGEAQPHPFAPREQQLPRLKGDETFTLEGMHAAHASWSSRLPGVLVRGFVRRSGDAGGGFEEVALRLDNVVIDADAMTLTLLWRGSAPVNDLRARDVIEAYASVQSLGDDAPSVAMMEQRWRAATRSSAAPPALAPPVETPRNLDQGPTSEPPAESPDAATNDASDPSPVRDLQRNLVLRRETLRRHLAELAGQPGLPPEQREALRRGLAGELAPVTTRSTAGDATSLAELLAPLKDRLDPKVFAELREAAQRWTRTASEMGEAMPLGPKPLMPSSHAEEPLRPEETGVRAQLMRRLRRGAPIRDLNLRDADLSALDLEGVDLSGIDLTQADLSTSRLNGANLHRTILKEARLRSADLSGANLTEAQLGAADLSHAVLDGASLARADLSEATMLQASLRNADLAGASFDRVDATSAVFERAHGLRADFADAKLADASFREVALEHADLSGATLTGASFTGATMPHLRLYGAKASGSVWDDAILEGARADDVQLKEASLRRVSAPGSVWEGAEMHGSVWHGAKLNAASLVRSNAQKAGLRGVSLRGARLHEARLDGADLRGSDLMQTSLELATLLGADLRRSNMHGADTLETNWQAARLEGALLTNTKFDATRRRRQS